MLRCDTNWEPVGSQDGKQPGVPGPGRQVKTTPVCCAEILKLYRVLTKPRLLLRALKTSRLSVDRTGGSALGKC